MMNLICKDCGKALNNIELHYYGDRCEQCEVKWLSSITAWQHGDDNEEFDELFDIPKPTEN